MKKLIQYPMPQYQPLSGMVPPITVQEFRGVSTYDPFTLSESYFTEVSNFVTDDFPTMTTRPGYTVIGNPIGTKILGLTTWKNDELHAWGNDGTWRKWNGSAWVSLESGLNTNAEWFGTNFQGNLADINLIAANGVDGLHRYDGSTVQTFGDAPDDINFITTYSNRLWGASGIDIRASALDQPEEWNKFEGLEDDSYAKTMESTEGENVNMVQGGLSKLVVGMPNSLHEMYGDLPSDFKFRLITEETGVANNKSAFVKDNVLRFIHKTGLYEYVSGGVSPDWSFSDIVKEFPIDDTVTAAATDGKKFYFLIESGKMLVFDPRLQTWVVFDGINATCFTIFQNELYIGDSQGRVLRLGGDTDNGSPIVSRLVTKPFTAESVAQRVKWIKMFTFWELRSGTTLKVSFSPKQNGDDWTEVGSFTGTGSNNIERIIIPVREFQLENMVRIKFDVVGWARLHQYTRQVRHLPLR